MAQRIVLTGGPCGGKTTAMSRMTEAISCTGRDSKTLGLPYVLTLKHAPIHD